MIQVFFGINLFKGKFVTFINSRGYQLQPCLWKKHKTKNAMLKIEILLHQKSCVLTVYDDLCHCKDQPGRDAGNWDGVSIHYLCQVTQ